MDVCPSHTLTLLSQTVRRTLEQTTPKFAQSVSAPIPSVKRPSVLGKVLGASSHEHAKLFVSGMPGARHYLLVSEMIRQHFFHH